MEHIQGDRDFKLVEEAQKEMRSFETGHSQWIRDELGEQIRLGNGAAFMKKLQDMRRAQKRELKKV